MEGDVPSLAAVIGTFAVDAGLAWMTGCIVMAGRSWSTAGTGLRGLVPAAAWTAVALAFDLWRRSAEAAAVPLLAARDATITMLTATHYGHAWMVGMAALLVIVTTSRLGGSARAARIVGLLGLLSTRSVVSHAGGAGDLSLAVAVDVLHLAAASVWVGAVWYAAWPTRPANDPSALRRLSTIATIALATILLSGVANGWRATAGSLAGLWGSPYGTTLAAKVALVFCAAGLGGWNRWVHLPRWSAGGASGRSAARAFRTVLRVEALVLAVVTLLAAVLSNLEPPGSM